jgi:hypothetical protein
VGKDERPNIEHEQTPCILACSGSEVIYYAENLPSSSVAEWTITGAQNFYVGGNGNFVTVLWPDEAVFGNIALQVTCSDNSVCFTEICIEIIEKPTAGIISNPMETEIINSVQHLYVCDGQSIDFVSNSTGSADAPIVGYYWADGYNTWSTEGINIVASYNLYGEELHLIHKVINECGCYDEVLYVVHISKNPRLKVDCYGTTCEDKTVIYAAVEGNECENYLWSVYGGEIISGQSTNTIQIHWNDVDDNGYGYLAVDNRLCDPEGCPYHTYLPIPIIVDSVNISGPDTVCVGEVVIFEAPLWGSTSYRWYIDPYSSQDVSVFFGTTRNKYPLMFNSPGTYTISLDYENDFLECTGTAREKTVIVKKPFKILSDEQACAGSEVIFGTDAGSGGNLEFLWKVYDNNMLLIFEYIGSELNYMFLTPGNYTITAYNDLFCAVSRKAIEILELPPAPEPDVTGWDSKICIGKGYVYETQNEPPYFLHWESCGDPEMFDANEYNVSFNNICDIYLMNVDPITGCMSEPFIFELEEFVPQSINLGNPEICANAFDYIQVPEENNVLYEWFSLSADMLSIGVDRYSNRVGIQANNADGIANLRLRRTYCDTYVDDTIPVTVIPGIIPEIDYPATICQGTSYLLRSANTGNTIAGTWTWTIEGNTYTTNNATQTSRNYTFQNTGTVAVRLSFRGNGCVNTYETVVSVNVVPSPDVSLSFLPNGSTGTLSVSDQQGGNTYSWSTGQTGSPITVSAPFDPVYYCTITNSYNCIFMDNVSTVIDSSGGPCPPLNRDIGVNVNCGSATFLYSSASVGTTNKYWDIDFNSAAPNPVVNPVNNNEASATFRNAGTYRIVVAEIYNGCEYVTDSFFAVPLIPRMAVTHECPGGNNNIRLNLQNASDYIAGLNMSLVWRVNNTIVYPDVNGYVTVPAAINTVKLSITYTYNGVTETCHIEETFNHVRSNVTFSTNPTVYCEGTPIQFTDNSATPVSWRWSFGPNIYNLSQNPKQTFQNSGYVSVSLQIQDHLGCYSTTQQSLNIAVNRLAGSILATGTYCSGEEWPVSYEFTNPFMESNLISYYWQPVEETTSLPANTFTRTGSYYVFLTQSTTGCQYQSAYVNLKFENKPTAIISGNDVFCYDDNIKLFGNTGDYEYIWYNLTNGTILATTPNLDLPSGSLNAGTYSLRLVVTNENCSDSTEKVIVIHPLSTAPRIELGDNVCLHEPPVDIISIDNLMLYWSTGTYGTRTEAYVYGYHSAYYLDANGCKSDYAYQYVEKNPDFDELLTGCFKMCERNLPKYLIAPSGRFDHWYWYHNDVEIDSGDGSIGMLMVDRFGIYNLEIKYAGACRAVSPDLVIEPEDCYCETDMELINVSCVGAKNCIPRILIDFNIYNESSISTVEILNMWTPDGEVNPYYLQNYLGEIINPEDHITATIAIDLDLMLGNYITLMVEFIQGNQICTDTLLIDLELVRELCSTDDCEVEFISYSPDHLLSSEDMLYYHYEIYIGYDRMEIEVQSLTNGVVTSLYPEYYDGNNGIIHGSFAVSPARMREIVMNRETICFKVKSCDENRYGEFICIRDVCFVPEFDKCKTKVELKNANCFIDDCGVYVRYGIYVQNLGGSDLSLMNIYSPTDGFQILEIEYLPMYISANGENTLYFTVSADPDLFQSELILYFTDENGVYCQDDLTVPVADIMLRCVNEECDAIVESISPNPNLSNSDYLYFNFVIKTNAGAINASATSSYGNVTSQFYNPETGYLTGVVRLTVDEYTTMVGWYICFEVELCFPDYICTANTCIEIPDIGCKIEIVKYVTDCHVDSTGLYVRVVFIVQNTGNSTISLTGINISEGNIFYIYNDMSGIAPGGFGQAIFYFYPANLEAGYINNLFIFETDDGMCVFYETINLQEVIEDCIFNDKLECFGSYVMPEFSDDEHIYVEFDLGTMTDAELIEVYSSEVEIVSSTYDPQTGIITVGTYLSAEDIENILIYGEGKVCFTAYLLKDGKFYRVKKCCDLNIDECDIKLDHKGLRCFIVDGELYIEIIDMHVANYSSLPYLFESIMASHMELVSIEPSIPYILSNGNYQYFNVIFKVENPEANLSHLFLSFVQDGNYCYRQFKIPVKGTIKNCIGECDTDYRSHWETNWSLTNSDYEYIDFIIDIFNGDIIDAEIYVMDGYQNVIDIVNYSYHYGNNSVRGLLTVPDGYLDDICIVAYLTDVYGKICRLDICRSWLKSTNIQMINDNGEDSKNLIPVDIVLYPNPATDICTVNLDCNNLSEIIIFDMHGKEISRHKDVEFSVAGLTPGNYIVSVRTVDNNIQYIKLLKQ